MKRVFSDEFKKLAESKGMTCDDLYDLLYMENMFSSARPFQELLRKYENSESEEPTEKVEPAQDDSLGEDFSRVLQDPVKGLGGEELGDEWEENYKEAWDVIKRVSDDVATATRYSRKLKLEEEVDRIMAGNPDLTLFDASMITQFKNMGAPNDVSYVKRLAKELESKATEMLNVLGRNPELAAEINAEMLKKIELAEKIANPTMTTTIRFFFRIIKFKFYTFNHYMKMQAKFIFNAYKELYSKATRLFRRK